MPFPSKVQVQPAIAVAGDFASSNPRASVLATAGALKAGTSGLTVGLFAWLDSTGTLASNAGQGVPAGFVHREQQALITTYLAEAGMTVPAGFPVTLFKGGDFFGKTATAATRGQKVFAAYATGGIATAAAGSTIAGATLTGTVSGSVLTVSAQSVNPIAVGDLVIGLSPATYITSFGTGTGGTGTYNLSTSGATGTATGTTSYVETKWQCQSIANAGELIKFSATLEG